MTKLSQLSDSFTLYLLLALSGGSMDAYSYLFRGHVFANAQTGNILLLGVKLAERDFASAFLYLYPILAFSLGIVLSDIIRRLLDFRQLHWRQLVLFIEIVVLLSVCFISKAHDSAANALISFACGLQVESFRSGRGNAAATTMCIGNLRSGMHDLSEYLITRRPERIKSAGIYFSIIFFFVLGAVIESILINKFAENALCFSAAVLGLGFCLLFIKPNSGADGRSRL